MRNLTKDTGFIVSLFTISVLIISIIFSCAMSTSNKVEAKDISENILYNSYDKSNTDKTYVSAQKYGYFKLDMLPILQYPELPTGCEITALTTVLNYYNCNVDKSYLAEYYLEQGNVGQTNPLDAFVGSPFSDEAYGCYSDVIVNAAQSYINDYRTDLKVENISELDFPQLLNYVKKGQPVIFWTTMNLKKPYESTSWLIDGEKVPWYAYEHCMVLIGFDYDTDCYIVSDPLKGITEYKRELMENRYNQIGKHAVLVY